MFFRFCSVLSFLHWSLSRKICMFRWIICFFVRNLCRAHGNRILIHSHKQEKIRFFLWYSPCLQLASDVCFYFIWCDWMLRFEKSNWQCNRFLISAFWYLEATRLVQRAKWHWFAKRAPFRSERIERSKPQWIRIQPKRGAGARARVQQEPGAPWKVLTCYWARSPLLCFDKT